jgi:hypothetical protein
MITARKSRSDKKQLSPYELQLSQKLREKGKVGGGTYSETTIQVYVSKCRLAHQRCHPGTVLEDMEWTKDYQYVKEKLNYILDKEGKRIKDEDGKDKETSNPQKSGFYNSIIMICSLYDDYPSEVMGHYEIIRDELKKTKDDNYSLGGSQQKQKILEEVSKDDIEKMLDELRTSKKKEDESPDQYEKRRRKEQMTWLMMRLTILFSLRNEIASVRLRIAKKLPVDAGEGNWLVKLSAKKYVLVRNNYKTSARYGQKINDITGVQIISRLNKWIKTEDIKDGDLLFTAFDQGRKTPLHSYDISHYFGDITKDKLKVRISTTLLYSIYSASPSDLSKATLEDTTKMKKQADNRGHTMAIKLSVYDKQKK